MRASEIREFLTGTCCSGFDGCSVRSDCTARQHQETNTNTNTNAMSTRLTQLPTSSPLATVTTPPVQDNHTPTIAPWDYQSELCHAYFRLTLPR